MGVLGRGRSYTDTSGSKVRAEEGSRGRRSGRRKPLRWSRQKPRPPRRSSGRKLRPYRPWKRQLSVRAGRRREIFQTLASLSARSPVQASRESLAMTLSSRPWSASAKAAFDGACYGHAAEGEHECERSDWICMHASYSKSVLVFGWCARKLARLVVTC